MFSKIKQKKERRKTERPLLQSIWKKERVRMFLFLYDALDI